MSLRSNLSLYALLYDARVVSLQTTFFPSPADSLLFSTYKGSSERRSGKPGMTFHLGRSCGSLLVFVCLFLWLFYHLILPGPALLCFLRGNPVSQAISSSVSCSPSLGIFCSRMLGSNNTNFFPLSSHPCGWLTVSCSYFISVTSVFPICFKVFQIWFNWFFVLNDC